MDNIACILTPPLKHKYELIVAVDNKKIDDIAISNRLLATFPELHNYSIFNTGNKPPSKFDMPSRRTRIAELRNRSKDFIGGSDFVFSYEDDTVLPMYAIDKLLHDWEEAKNPGLIEGVQIGRWGKPYIGAWRVDNLMYPTHYETIIREDFAEDVEAIDAGGFYCYLTVTKLYKLITYSWSEPVGPDVDFGLQLRRLGYDNFIDWSVICGHKTHDKILYPDRKVSIVTFDRRSGDESGKWENKILDKMEVRVE